MRLTDALIATYFGSEPPPATLLVGLAAAGSELTDHGYQPQPVQRGGWTLRGAVASAQVTFGPFDGRVVFDEAILMDADRVVLDRAAIGSWTVPALQGFMYAPEFEVTSDESGV